MQGRIQIDVHIMDSNLMQESKNVHSYEFYYNANKVTSDYICIGYDDICISM